MLSSASSVRFFWLPPLPDTAAALRRPATLAPLLSAGAGSSERLRLQGQPLSWLLARSGLSCRPPNPQAVLVPRIFLAGVAAPLLFCAPACASARRFPLWCAKAHRVSPPHRCHPCPRWPYWCLPLRVRRRQEARPPPLRIETVRGHLSGGSAALARTGREG